MAYHRASVVTDPPTRQRYVVASSRAPGCRCKSPRLQGLGAARAEGAMQAQAAGGPGAYARRSFAAADALTGRRYVAALVEEGSTVGLGASALAAPPGCPAILVFCLQARRVLASDKRQARPRCWPDSALRRPATLALTCLRDQYTCLAHPRSDLSELYKNALVGCHAQECLQAPRHRQCCNCRVASRVAINPR